MQADTITVTFCGREWVLAGPKSGSIRVSKCSQLALSLSRVRPAWAAYLTNYGQVSAEGPNPQAAVSQVESKLRLHYDELKGLLYPGE